MKNQYVFAAFALTILLLISACNKNTVSEPSGVIAFTSMRDGNMELYSMDADGENLLRLTDHPDTDYHSSWSKDGSFLLFYSNRNGNDDIFYMRYDGSELKQITRDTAREVIPEISPDGTQIAYMRQTPGGPINLFLMSLEGDSIAQLTDNEFYEESPDWSPDGSKIIFTRQIREPADTTHAANGEIFELHLATGEEKRLTNKLLYDSGAKYSPDGEKIAFYGLEADTWDIYLMNADGSQLENLTADSIECYSPSWSPDGNWITYTAGDSENYEIWIMNVKTREKRQLTNSPGRDAKPDWGMKYKAD